MNVQQAKGYHQGFYDAQCGEPLFDDASPDYRAGWLGFYELKRILEALP